MTFEDIYENIRLKIKEKLKYTAPIRIIAVSFILIILIGTCLLSTSIAVKGDKISFLDAAFTATSATCVTGLSVFDTYSTFSYFGQAVILVLIQVGGLGLATLATAFTLFFRKKLGYRNLTILSEAAGGSDMNIVTLLKVIIAVTFSCEILGASLLMIHFIPNYGIDGIWPSIFISVSAFCNAGFDVLGFIPGNSSMSSLYDSNLVLLTVSGLIFVGSLGFLVMQDIYISKIYGKVKRHYVRKLSFHSQICIRISAALLIIGAVLFFVFEHNNTLSDMTLIQKLVNSLFQSVNTRTAGFASINVGDENAITKILTIILMFIGGSPGSTAGGIKVTTFVVVLAVVISTIRGDEDATFLSHRFDKKLVYKTITILFLSCIIIIMDFALIYFFNRVDDSLNLLFECFSAFGTVGLSTGLTSSLSSLSKIVIMITMFVGRVGPASLGIAIMIKPRKQGETILPEGRMLIG